MIPLRVLFLSDTEDAPAIDRELLARFRADVEAEILKYGAADAQMVNLGDGLGKGFLTVLPRPLVGRVLARWFLKSDEETVVTGLRSGEQEYERPPDDDYDDL